MITAIKTTCGGHSIKEPTLKEINVDFLARLFAPLIIEGYEYDYGEAAAERSEGQDDESVL